MYNLPTYDTFCSRDSYRRDPHFNHQAPSRGWYYTDGMLNVYKSGYIEVVAAVDGKPDVRYAVKHKYGLEFSLTSEVTGCDFRTPDGEKVPKKYIDDTILFFDHTSNRAYGYANRYVRDSSRAQYRSARPSAAQINFAHKDARPTSASTIMVSLPDKQLVKDVLKEYKPYFDIALTTRHMAGRMYGLAGKVHNCVEELLDGTFDPSANMDVETLRSIGSLLEPGDTYQLRTLLTEESKVTTYVNYLTY